MSVTKSAHFWGNNKFFFSSMFESTNKVAADNLSPHRPKVFLRGKIIKKNHTGPTWQASDEDFPPPPFPIFGLKKIKLDSNYLSRGKEKRPNKKRKIKNYHLTTSFLPPFFFLSVSLLVAKSAHFWGNNKFIFFSSMFESTNKVAADNPSPQRPKVSLRGKIIKKKNTTRTCGKGRWRRFLPPLSSFWIKRK